MQNDTFYDGKDIFSRGVLAAGAELKESVHFSPGWCSIVKLIKLVYEYFFKGFSLLDAFRLKRERTANLRALEVESEQEEHSLSLSQHSSPSQSDQEQTQVFKANDSVRGSQEYHFLKNFNQNHSDGQPDGNVLSSPKTLTIDSQGSLSDLILGGQQVITRQEPSFHVAHNYRQGLHHRPEQTLGGSAPIQNMVISQIYLSLTII